MLFYPFAERWLVSVVEPSRSECLLFFWCVVEAEHAPTEVKMLVLHVLDGACTVSTIFV